MLQMKDKNFLYELRAYLVHVMVGERHVSALLYGLCKISVNTIKSRTELSPIGAVESF